MSFSIKQETIVLNAAFLKASVCAGARRRQLWYAPLVESASTSRAPFARSWINPENLQIGGLNLKCPSRT